VIDQGAIITPMNRILRFEELKCWQEARELTKRIYQLTQDGTINSDHYLTGQMRRSAVSIVSNIAEGKERETASEFVRFLYVAKGSAGELQAQLTIASDIEAITEKDFSELSMRASKVSSMLGALIASIKKRP
jgi:four helix bundle protein